ncbi:hypothetical protein Y032_0012g1827 [Ancylostoma ceylanicum]|uniref:Uncharacterized protein n=1 Tax=Ancylostoma ceylanicum TaxID=53326 RepID=A0A016VD18_9BILA|nr:hypothetical protein Y032_0012g1827 [Ancylostoma ceylanicum]
MKASSHRNFESVPLGTTVGTMPEKERTRESVHRSERVTGKTDKRRDYSTIVACGTDYIPLQYICTTK